MFSILNPRLEIWTQKRMWTIASLELETDRSVRSQRASPLDQRVLGIGGLHLTYMLLHFEIEIIYRGTT